MAVKGTTFANDFLKLIFNATAIADIAENDSSSPITTLTLALHTADPGDAGNQSTSEIAYTGYARQTITRNGAGWVVTSNSVSPANNCDFPKMTGGAGGVVTHVSIGTGISNKMLYRFALTPNISVVSGVIPRIENTSTLTEV